MNRYRELYSELQDFRRQQPFGFTRFFGNMPVNVYATNGTVIQQTPALVLHEQVHQQLASLTPVQIEKYSNDLARIMNLFVRWLQYTNRVRGWRGQAEGKENQSPQTRGSNICHRRRSYFAS